MAAVRECEEGQLAAQLLNVTETLGDCVFDLRANEMILPMLAPHLP